MPEFDELTTRQRLWATHALDDAAAQVNRKTLLKNARDIRGEDVLVDESLIVAQRKRAAYFAARSGATLKADNWINLDPELAEATHALCACGILIHDIPMIPDPMGKGTSLPI